MPYASLINNLSDAHGITMQAHAVIEQESKKLACVRNKAAARPFSIPSNYPAFVHARVVFKQIGFSYSNKSTYAN